MLAADFLAEEEFGSGHAAPPEGTMPVGLTAQWPAGPTSRGPIRRHLERFQPVSALSSERTGALAAISGIIAGNRPRLRF